MIGRKRKLAKREPNGRAQREQRGIDPRAIAQLQPHRRLVPADVAHDPKAECLMGRLALNGWITEIQYQAGLKYREILTRYRAVLGSRPDAASMSGVIVGPWSGGAGLCDCENWNKHCQSLPGGRCAQKRVDDYMKSFEVISEAGVARDVSHLVNDQQLFAIPRVKCGLTALAAYYGLTFSRKRETVINRG